jgi:hypothetical protein
MAPPYLLLYHVRTADSSCLYEKLSDSSPSLIFLTASRISASLMPSRLQSSGVILPSAAPLNTCLRISRVCSFYAKTFACILFNTSIWSSSSAFCKRSRSTSSIAEMRAPAASEFAPGNPSLNLFRVDKVPVLLNLFTSECMFERAVPSLRVSSGAIPDWRSISTSWLCFWAKRRSFCFNSLTNLEMTSFSPKPFLMISRKSATSFWSSWMR